MRMTVVRVSGAWGLCVVLSMARGCRDSSARPSTLHGAIDPYEPSRTARTYSENDLYCAVG